MSIESSVGEDLEVTHEQIPSSASGLPPFTSLSFTATGLIPAGLPATGFTSQGTLPSDDSHLLREFEPSPRSFGFAAPPLPQVKLKTPPKTAHSAGISQDTPNGSCGPRFFGADPGTMPSDGKSFNDSTLFNELIGGLHGTSKEQWAGSSQHFRSSFYGAMKPGYPNNFKLHFVQAQDSARPGSCSSGSSSGSLLKAFLSSPSASQSGAESITIENEACCITGSGDNQKLAPSIPHPLPTDQPAAQHISSGPQPPAAKHRKRPVAPRKQGMRKPGRPRKPDHLRKTNKSRKRPERRSVKDDPQTINGTPRNYIFPGEPISGCWTCKLRRKKCDGARPECQACLRLGIGCMGYDRTGSRPDFMLDPVKNKEMRALVSKKVLESRKSRSVAK